MTVYAIAQLKFTDEPAYRRYQARFWEVFKAFDGQLLAADEAPLVTEGDWDGDKVVLMAFPDRDAYEAFAQSDAYQAISEDRRAGAHTVALLVQGLGR
jgi:uncharacterized protein (DUF1330 family)